ncbi:MAG TPA: hypothetical protein VFS30_04560 [Dehalococcoidia bacterium]|nr:hypothetical protein [Dehalococcoidia bacterium]
MKLYERINGPWHGRALLILFAVILFHMFEHVVQVVQTYLLGVDRVDALGLLGVWMPDLIRSETVHFGFSVYTWSAIFLTGGAAVGMARNIGLIALSVQSWHLLEHSTLIFQRATDSFFFGASEPTSLAQLLIPRVELHFIYNGVVFSAIVIALLLHAYPPRGETARSRCVCTMTPTVEVEAVPV